MIHLRPSQKLWLIFIHLNYQDTHPSCAQACGMSQAIIPTVPGGIDEKGIKKTDCNTCNSNGISCKTAAEGIKNAGTD